MKYNTNLLVFLTHTHKKTKKNKKKKKRTNTRETNMQLLKETEGDATTSYKIKTSSSHDGTFQYKIKTSSSSHDGTFQYNIKTSLGLGHWTSVLAFKDVISLNMKGNRFYVWEEHSLVFKID